VALNDGRPLWRIKPWPLESSIAFLCLRDPGSAFAGPAPSVPDAAGCIALEVSSDSANTIEVAVPNDISAADRQAFQQASELYLAVAGQRNSVTTSKVITVEPPTFPDIILSGPS